MVYCIGKSPWITRLSPVFRRENGAFAIQANLSFRIVTAAALESTLRSQFMWQHSAYVTSHVSPLEPSYSSPNK